MHFVIIPFPSGVPIEPRYSAQCCRYDLGSRWRGARSRKHRFQVWVRWAQDPLTLCFSLFLHTVLIQSLCRCSHEVSVSIFPIAWESAAVTGIYPCVVQPHNFNRICLKWDRLSNKKETAVSICHLHMSSSVDYVKPLKLNRHMCILERSFGYFFIIQAFCKLPSHFTKCLVIL